MSTNQTPRFPTRAPIIKACRNPAFVEVTVLLPKVFVPVLRWQARSHGLPLGHLLTLALGLMASRGDEILAAYFRGAPPAEAQRRRRRR